MPTDADPKTLRIQELTQVRDYSLGASVTKARYCQQYVLSRIQLFPARTAAEISDSSSCKA